MKNSKIILGVTAFAILATALAVMLSASAYDHDQTYNANSTYFVPEIARVQEGHCHTTTVDVWTNTSVAVASGYVVFDYTQCCADVTSIQIDTAIWQDPGCDVFDNQGQVRIKFLNDTANGPGPVHIATLTIHCCNTSSCCLTNMTWNLTGGQTYLEDDAGAEIAGVNWADGVFVCGDPINVTKTVRDPATGEWVPSYSFPMGDEETGVNVTFNITVHAKCCDLTNIAVTDVLADELSYANSATVNGVPCEPQVSGQTLTWSYNAGACQSDFTDLDICNKIYIEFNATVTEYGEHKNSATATGWCNKSVLSVLVSNTSEAWVNLPSPARIEVIKTVWDPAKQKWVKALTPELDYVDIGDTASEAGHALTGWSTANIPGGYGGCNGGTVCTYRQVIEESQCDESGRNATFTMDAGSGIAKTLIFRHLDGLSDYDSFHVYVNDNYIGHYTDVVDSTETWVESSFDISALGLTGEFTVRIYATDTVWGSCSTYGQVAFDWAKLNADRAKICETYRFNCTIHNDGSEGLDLMNIEVWDIMTDSLEYAGNASMVTPDGITRDINPPTYLSDNKTRFNWTIDDYMQTPLTLHPCQSIIMEFDAHIVNYCNNSNTQYAKGQTSEGIWVYDNDTAWIKIPHPDLNVTKITVNPKLSRLCDMAFGPTNHTGARTQCNNISADIVEGEGIDVVFPFNVTFEVTNTTTGDSVLREPCIVRIPGTVANPSLEGGDTKTVYCNCSWYPFAHEDYTISVTVDSNKTVDPTRGEIRESDENNNTMVRNIAAHVHGLKGDSWQDGRNITALQCHEQGTINLTYSIGDSSKKGAIDLYNASGIYLANWTASDFTIPPAESCIKKARLYVYYNWDKTPDWNVTDYFTLKFNEHTISPDAIYNDAKHPDNPPECAGCPGSYTMCKYNQPYGMVAYDVMQEFVAGDNTANLALDPYVWQNNYTAMTGMLLVVVYNNSAEPERIIWINEGFDLLQAHKKYGTSSEEATTYAPFTPFAGDGCDAIPLDKIGKATLITITNHAANTPADDRNRLYFNGDLLGSGVWAPYMGATEIGDAVTDVPLELLKATNNTAAFQSHITPTKSGDYFEATNAFLVLEKGKATIEVVDPAECVGVGEQFDVPINVTPDNAAVYGVEYVIEFNASVIHAEWQNEGDFLKQGDASTNVYRNVIDNVNGKLEFAVTRQAPITTGATDPGTLAIIHFTAIEPSATTTVNLIHVKATDPEAQIIDVETVNSTVEVCDNTPPTADGKSRFKHNNVGAKYLSRTYFDGSASDDPDGYITYYRWWFGDGNDGVGETAEHLYGSFKWNGSINSYDPFNVSLTVQDDGTPILDDTDYLDVNVYMAGDTNGDGEVDIVDGSIVGLEFWAECSVGDNNWGSADRRDMADLNNDCEVDIIDASIVGVTFWDTAW